MNACAEEAYESEHVPNYIKKLHAILDAKYEKSDVNKVMENKCQYLTQIQRN